MMKTHELKSWQEFFEAVLQGEKTFEVRYNDRGYRVGDMLRLREWNGKTGQYTGRELRMEVKYIMPWSMITGYGIGLLPGWVVMAIVPTGDAKI